MFKHLKRLALICMLIYTTPNNVHAQNDRAHPVSAKTTTEGYTLSINSKNLPLGLLLEALINQCQLRVITYEEIMVSQPITISFKDVPLEQGIKRLFKAAGIKNYFIQYKNNEKGKPSIAAVTLLGNGTNPGGNTIIEDFINGDKEKRGINPITEPRSPEDEFTKKVTALKERYEWADKETVELAGHLLELMPEPARGQGVEALMKELDRKIAKEGNERVDETIFFKALANTAPSPLAPVMMESINRYIQRYKAGTTDETFEQSPNELYQEVMSNKFSEGMIP